MACCDLGSSRGGGPSLAKKAIRSQEADSGNPDPISPVKVRDLRHQNGRNYGTTNQHLGPKVPGVKRSALPASEVPGFANDRRFGTSCLKCLHREYGPGLSRVQVRSGPSLRRIQFWLSPYGPRSGISCRIHW